MVQSAKECYRDRLSVTNHLVDFLKHMSAGERLRKRGWVEQVLRLREGRESTLLMRKGSAPSKGEGGSHGQRRRIGVCLAKRSLREIEHHAMCCLVMKRWRSDEWFIERVRGMEAPRQDPKDLKCDARLGPASGSRSGITRDRRMQVLLCPCMSYEIKIDRVFST